MVIKWKTNNGCKNKNNAENIDLYIQLLKLIDAHEITYLGERICKKIDNERCDKLAILGIKSESKLVDTEYVNHAERAENYGEVLKEGDECRICSTKGIKRIPKKRRQRITTISNIIYFA